MKLDRNITQPRRGKYALIKLRNEPSLDARQVAFMEETAKLVSLLPKSIDFGDTADTDFFVIRLKDKYAGQALHAYALAASDDGEDEYAKEIFELSRRALNHPNKRKPD